MNRGCKKERKGKERKQSQSRTSFVCKELRTMEQECFIKGKNGGKKSDKSKIQCYNCEKWGHYAFECRSKGKKKLDNEAHHARQHDSDSDGFLLMVTTNSESDNSKLCKVKFADDSTISVEGKGKVMVQRKNANHTFVTDVLYVPSMKHNLLSLGQLLEKGFNYSTKDHNIQVFDPQNKLILKAPLSNNRTFKVNLQASAFQCFSSLITEDEKWL
ncbi:retrovirus-related Pol polyprotein from transposon TNT 1-94 [Trifolium pratense]|uniref:Retrovirus-related Pol polyprotein from transposon TNT 1-94 n=2 Tax=Trifolium pratense TaxID=57577 RepID=A0A2K3LBX7_TRIPR|nr:retrovirus-related Pol polyprotein from transposon TNT 1-94 [Trifolium pratense]